MRAYFRRLTIPMLLAALAACQDRDDRMGTTTEETERPVVGEPATPASDNAGRVSESPGQGPGAQQAGQDVQQGAENLGDQAQASAQGADQEVQQRLSDVELGIAELQRELESRGDQVDEQTRQALTDLQMETQRIRSELQGVTDGDTQPTPDAEIERSLARAESQLEDLQNRL